jgi:hypothetical protein
MLFLERNRHELAVHMLRNVSLSQGYDLEVIEKNRLYGCFQPCIKQFGQGMNQIQHWISVDICGSDQLKSGYNAH